MCSILGQNDDVSQRSMMVDMRSICLNDDLKYSDDILTLLIHDKQSVLESVTKGGSEAEREVIRWWKNMAIPVCPPSSAL